ncbi:hypothetical protein ABI59_18075 [Acidobacteria bacterium Mor1]|nr:hypothetical protein ABI59_18075 [Acidobacteria bacterium Mor1]
MSARLSALFLRNKYLLFLSIGVILVAGASALTSLPRQEDPRIANRNPLVITQVPGASAERVETLVTEKIENKLEELAEVKRLQSFSRAGISLINVEFQDSIGHENNDQAFSKVRDKIRDAIPLLPPEAREPEVDDRRDPAAFTLIVGLTWDGPGDAEVGLQRRLAEELADRLRNVDGTELVRLYGAPDEEIAVTVDADELAALGLDAFAVSRAIAAADAKLPAGTLRGRSADLQLEIEGELDSIRRVAEVPLRSGSDGGLVRVGDIAEVTRGWQQPHREIGLVDGARAVFVAARMDSGLRIDRWHAEAMARVDRFEAELGDGVRVDIVFDQQDYTSARLLELASNLVAGAAVVVVIVFLMMGWRAALTVGLALPLTVSLTLFAMQVMGGAIHQISIYGIIVALGLLIDNAIVAVDDTSKLLRAGRSRLDAVREAVGHLFLPLGASTVTTILAFAPIVLLPGSVGDFVGDIGRSVILALAFSFLVAMTIIAALAGLTGDTTPTERGGFLRRGLRTPRLTAAYRKGLRSALQAPGAAILLAMLLPLAGFIIAGSLGNEFFPPVDRNMFELKVWMPSESSIEHTLEETRRIEEVLREQAGVERVFWLVGGSFPSVYYNQLMNQDNVAGYAQAILVTDSAERTAALVPELQRILDRRFPAVQTVTRSFGQGPPVEADIEYRLFGPDLDRLRELGETYRLRLQQHPDVLHTQATIARDEPKLWLDADEDALRLAGLDLQQVAGQLQVNLEGGVGGSILEQLEEVPVRVRYDDGTRAELARIASTNLVRGGDWVPLPSIGTLELRPELGGISRYNGRRTNTIKAFTAAGSLPIDVTRQVLEDLEAEGFVLPDGYSLELGGFAEADSSATGNLLIYVPVLATLMVSILILTFRSLRLAGLLGVVAILSAGLGLLATWTIDFPISFNTFLGILGLIGVAFNDSIVVLAAIRANPAGKRAELDAVVEEVLGVSRHIVSTTLTTVGGFLPLLIFVGGDFWPGLAIVMVGGVFGAMIMALLMVPAAYMLFFGGKRAAAPAPSPTPSLQEALS